MEQLGGRSLQEAGSQAGDAGELEGERGTPGAGSKGGRKRGKERRTKAVKEKAKESERERAPRTERNTHKGENKKDSEEERG